MSYFLTNSGFFIELGLLNIMTPKEKRAFVRKMKKAKEAKAKERKKTGAKSKKSSKPMKIKKSDLLNGVEKPRTKKWS